jgi:hypothetical protein
MMYREMDMRFWLEQAGAEMHGRGWAVIGTARMERP